VWCHTRSSPSLDLADAWRIVDPACAIRTFPVHPGCYDAPCPGGMAGEIEVHDSTTTRLDLCAVGPAGAVTACGGQSRLVSAGMRCLVQQQILVDHFPDGHGILHRP